MKVYTEEEVKKLRRSVGKVLNENGLGCDGEIFKNIYDPVPIEVELHAVVSGDKIAIQLPKE